MVYYMNNKKSLSEKNLKLISGYQKMDKRGKQVLDRLIKQLERVNPELPLDGRKKSCGH